MRHVPQRSCIGCRTVRSKRELVRVVHRSDERFELDTTGKLPGRGAYLCPNTECLAAAVKRKGFERAFRESVPREVVAELAEHIGLYLSAQETGENPPASAPGVDGD